MKAVFQLFKKHPIALICFSLYTPFSIRALQIHLQFREKLKHLKPGQSGLAAGGEAVGFMDVFYVIVTGIFLLVIFANAIGRKEGTKFYLWLSLAIIIQVILVFNIG